MMKRRSKADWQALVLEQQGSGLNASEFCRQRDINEKYFSLRKQALKKSMPVDLSKRSVLVGNRQDRFLAR